MNSVKPKRPPFDPRLAPRVASRLVSDKSNDQAQFAPLANTRLHPDALRQRFANPPLWTPELTGDQFRFDDRPVAQAAVLVPIIMHGSAPSVLLTVRSAHLNDHAGQVAFPGGRRDETDASFEATALREAFEEIGLHHHAVDILGQLPVYQTGTGYAITPVVALVQANPKLELQASEVDDAFEVPLHFLMNPANHQQRAIQVGDQERLFYAMPYSHHGKEFFVWGATAAIIRNLYLFLSA